MGDVYLCRVDEKKLNGKQNDVKNDNKILTESASFINKTQSVDNDESMIRINQNNNNKVGCIKLTVKNSDTSNNNEEGINQDDNVKIFNKNKKNNRNITLPINLNNNNNSNGTNNNENLMSKDKMSKNNENNENRNLTEDINNDSEDENSNKYEKTLINKNMRKTQSSQKDEPNLKINIPNSKLFNEKQASSSRKDNSQNRNIQFPQITKLISRSKENIPCLEFEGHDVINISIGDLEVIHLENMSTFNINDDTSTYNYSKLRNYKTENDHIEFCETSTCMMKNSCFLIIFTQYGNFDSEIVIKETKYENKNLQKFELVDGTLKMSNYAIPFDFDGDQFLFIDYFSKEERVIRIVYTTSKKKDFVFFIKKEFGHISHMKLLSNNKIFLCRNNNQCEIHLINENFDLIEKWTHIGDDVISCCLFVEKIINEEMNFNKDNNNNKENTEKKDEDKNQNIKDGNILKLLENNNHLDSQISKQTKKMNESQTLNASSNRKSKIKNELKHIDYDQIIILSNGNEKVYNQTQDNNRNSNKKNSFKNNIQYINPSFDNSSRRDMNYPFENKIFFGKSNQKSNKELNSILIDSDKKKKIQNKNSLTSVEVYGKQNKKVKKKRTKLIYNESNLGENEDIQTAINSKIREKEQYLIYTLDQNGSLNLYTNKTQKTIFNIYNIDNIDEIYKKTQFFSVGFPYYIAINNFYYFITTDHGLFVISKAQK